MADALIPDIYYNKRNLSQDLRESLKYSKGATMEFFSKISEDWWAVIIAFLLIILATIGILGDKFIKITF